MGSSRAGVRYHVSVTQPNHPTVIKCTQLRNTRATESEAAGQAPDIERRMVLLRLATAYSSSLMHAPIPTKALTAALVGLTGDALAQGADANV